MSESEEDRLLAWEQFDDLNRSFYCARSGPHHYIEARYRALLLVTSSSDLIARAGVEGFAIGDLRIAFSDDGEDDDEVQQRQRDFLITESSVLLHHAGEALMRLYFAHAGLPECPRLEAARLRQFWLFKRRLDEFAGSLQTEETRRAIMDVFTGANRSEGLDSSVPTEKWVEQRDGLVALLGTVARTLLSDGDMYNSAKHGLAVVPSDAAVNFAFGPGAPDIDLSAEGLALTYLQIADTSKGKRWQETLSWVSAESDLSLIFWINQQIKSLLNVARARYVDIADGYQVNPITAEMVNTVVEAGWPTKPFLIKSMGKSLLYYAEENEARADDREYPTPPVP